MEKSRNNIRIKKYNSFKKVQSDSIAILYPEPAGNQDIWLVNDTKVYTKPNVTLYIWTKWYGNIELHQRLC